MRPCFLIKCVTWHPLHAKLRGLQSNDQRETPCVKRYTILHLKRVQGAGWEAHSPLMSYQKGRFWPGGLVSDSHQPTLMVSGWWSSDRSMTSLNRLSMPPTPVRRQYSRWGWIRFAPLWWSVWGWDQAIVWSARQLTCARPTRIFLCHLGHCKTRTLRSSLHQRGSRRRSRL